MHSPCLQSRKSIVDHDTSVFVKKKPAQSRSDHELPVDWPGEQNIKIFISRASGLLIYIATVCISLPIYLQYVENQGSVIDLSTYISQNHATVRGGGTIMSVSTSNRFDGRTPIPTPNFLTPNFCPSTTVQIAHIPKESAISCPFS
jgi:hypothetical protein